MPRGQILQRPKPKIYLAGGLKSNWQLAVMESCGDSFIFFNPREHQLELDSTQYTAWDIFHIKQCEILFGYMESTNPSGLGLSLEVGYAKALNKTIILVNEKSKSNPEFERHFKIVENLADAVFDDLQKAICFLRRF